VALAAPVMLGMTAVPIDADATDTAAAPWPATRAAPAAAEPTATPATPAPEIGPALTTPVLADAIDTAVAQNRLQSSLSLRLPLPKL